MYGRGGDVSSNGQDGLVVIEVLVDNTSIVDAPSGTMTICENVAMSPIIHTTQNVNGLQSVTGLPPELIANYASNEIVISGTPTAAGLYEYSIVPEGCGTPIQRATGTIEVVAGSMAEITTPDPLPSD